MYRQVKQVKINHTDPLTAYTERFLTPSYREFHACHESLKASSITVALGFGLVSALDSDKRYTLIHYRDTTEEGYKTAAQHGGPIVRDERLLPISQLKGCIFDFTTGDLKARGFAFTPIYNIQEQDLVKVLDNLQPKSLVREWREGLVVRVWTDDNGTVRVSTTRKIDALRSRRDGCPSVGEMLQQANIDIENLKAGTNNIPLGTVILLLLVHPNNQIQNPEPVEPTVYHIDTWIKKTPQPTRGGKHRPDTLQSLQRTDLSINIPKLPTLSNTEAIDLFNKNKSIYIQKDGKYGAVYRSIPLSIRYNIRGEREHLYHRYVELGREGHRLFDCVPYAQRDIVKTFPDRFEADKEALLAYGETLFQPDSRLPPEDSSLYAWYLSSRDRNEPTPREKLLNTLNTCYPVIIYNMFSQLRNKVKKYIRHENEGSRPNTPQE